MITDEQIENLAFEQGITLMGINPKTFHESRINFARALYQLGRQHQRESDSALCKAHRAYTKFDSKEKYLAPYIFDGEQHEGVLFSEMIFKNIGDK